MPPNSYWLNLSVVLMTTHWLVPHQLISLINSTLCPSHQEGVSSHCRPAWNFSHHSASVHTHNHESLPLQHQLFLLLLLQLFPFPPLSWRFVTAVTSEHSKQVKSWTLPGCNISRIQDAFSGCLSSEFLILSYPSSPTVSELSSCLDLPLNLRYLPDFAVPPLLT